MSIFDLEPSIKSKPLLSKYISHIKDEADTPIFSGIMAVKTTSGRFKAKLIKIINKKMIFHVQEKNKYHHLRRINKRV